MDNDNVIKSIKPWLRKSYESVSNQDYNRLSKLIEPLIQETGADVRGFLLHKDSRLIAAAKILPNKQPIIILSQFSLNYTSDSELLGIIAHEIGHSFVNPHHKILGDIFPEVGRYLGACAGAMAFSAVALSCLPNFHKNVTADMMKIAATGAALSITEKVISGPTRRKIEKHCDIFSLIAGASLQPFFEEYKADKPAWKLFLESTLGNGTANQRIQYLDYLENTQEGQAELLALKEKYIPRD